MELLPFILATLTLLAIPGPTNTLLATSGAVVGVARSAPLLLAELAGYLTAVAALRLGLGPLMSNAPLTAALLRIGVVVYLFYLARLLWRYRSSKQRGRAAVTFRAVLVTTLLNPKALVFGLVLLPQQRGLGALLPCIAAMAALIVAMGGSWIALGAALERRLHGAGRPDLIYRLGAAALVVMATVMGVRTLGMV